MLNNENAERGGEEEGDKRRGGLEKGGTEEGWGENEREIEWRRAEVRKVGRGQSRREDREERRDTQEQRRSAAVEGEEALDEQGEKKCPSPRGSAGVSWTDGQSFHAAPPRL